MRSLPPPALARGRHHAERYGGGAAGYLAQLFQALGALGAGIVTVTGVRPQPDVIGNVACDCRTGEMHVSMRPAHPGVFYGTGDVFASALAALLVRRVEKIFEA